MNISPKNVHIDDNTLWIELLDGRTIGAPLAWFPRLLSATAAEREDFELTPLGIHWDIIDEDISIEGLLAGHGDQTRPPGHEAA